jgi:Zn-dependent protease with chaperone function
VNTSTEVLDAEGRAVIPGFVDSHTHLAFAGERSLEFAADAYAVQLGYDLRPALKQISQRNLADCSPDPLVSLCHHSHPTLVQRAEAVEALLAKKKAKQE